MTDWLVVIIGLLVVVLAVWQAVQLHQIRTRVRAVPQDGNVIALLGSVGVRLDGMEAGLASVDRRLQDVETRMPSAIAKVGVVSYDAFGNVAGRLSRSIAMLDERGNGILLSILVSRDATMLFSKEIRSGVSSDTLSPEEEDAVATALSR
ncbi:MAG: hypothetical protein BMS9Abin07_0159 [Acidimicrobiia bacterium]|nr:MAG: hypothetical protein BMS9Abin07_0159 [Acidimicrobiia bacterium]